MSSAISRTVDHRATLELFHLLKRVEPTATVSGTKEAARINGLVFTLSLAQTERRDTYDGLILRVINPEVGQLDATRLAFREYRVTTGPAKRILNILDYVSRADIFDGVSDCELEQAVRDYIGAFTDRLS
jgi:hypothetical protein